MSAPAPIETTPITDDFTDLGVSDGHIKCCERDVFICGAPFHPEAEATDDEGNCARCEKVRDDMECFNLRVGRHQHCPFALKRICPHKKGEEP